MIITGDAKLIASAFVKARGDMSATVAKDAKGNYGKYATLAAIVEAITPSLTKHGLAVVQEVSTDEIGVCVETWLVHESGATMQFTPLVLPLSDRRPQAVGSAATYARRYALAAICGLAPDDDDGQAAQDAQPQKRAPAPAKADLLTAEQAARIASLGEQYYKDEWDDKRTQLAELFSKGAVKLIDDLKPTEADKLITGLEKKLAQAAPKG